MLRILSDLHVYDGLSRVRRLEQLDPLLEGPDALLLNGDSCDTQIGATPEQVDALVRHIRSRAPQATFLTGNHDPDISSVHEQLLQDGRLWVTHGDVFFRDATPWSRLLPEIRRRIAAAQAEAPESSTDSLEWRLRVFRQIAHQLPVKRDPRRRDWRSLCERLTTEFGSPRRIWAVLQAWRQGPGFAAHIASHHRQSAQVVVFGHVHRASLSAHGDRTIINTGAFAGALGAWCVDVADETVVVRRVDHRRDAFHPGEVVREIPLARRTPARFTSAT